MCTYRMADGFEGAAPENEIFVEADPSDSIDEVDLGPDFTQQM